MPTGPMLNTPTMVAKVLLLSYTAKTRKAEKTGLVENTQLAEI